MLNGKKIILGITGSIAAYKACYIIRGLIKQGGTSRNYSRRKRIYHSDNSLCVDRQTCHQ